ncbi:hypothetical protein V6N13_042711 [Hibiscus sabdariffa]
MTPKQVQDDRDYMNKSAKAWRKKSNPTKAPREGAEETISRGRVDSTEHDLSKGYNDQKVVSLPVVTLIWKVMTSLKIVTIHRNVMLRKDTTIPIKEKFLC